MSNSENTIERIKALCKPITGLDVKRNKFRLRFTYKKKPLEFYDDTPLTEANVKVMKSKILAIKFDIKNKSFSVEKYFAGQMKKTVIGGDIKKIVTVKEAFTEYFKIEELKNRAVTSDNNKSKVNKHILPTFGEWLVTDVTANDIEEWMLSILFREKQLANKTVCNILTPFRCLYRKLKKDKIIDENIFDDISNPVTSRVADDTADPLDLAEINAIENTKTHCTSELNAFVFACFSGMRIGEWLSLGWDDVDFVNRKVRVKRTVVLGNYYQPKTAKSRRWVNLLEPAYQALLAQKAISYMLPPMQINVYDENNIVTYTEKFRCVFPSTFDKAPYTRSKHYAEQFFTNHLKKAGVRHRGANQARHTYASQLLTRGVSERWIANQMGHTSLAMLEKHYAKWLNNEIPDMADRVSRAMGFEPTPRDTDFIGIMGAL